MFGSIGITELVLIAGVALMVLGPEKFPEFAKMAARFVKDIRGYATDIQSEISKEMRPVQKQLEDLKSVDPEKYIDSLMEGEEDDDSPPNPEPHPSDVDFYPPADENDGVGEDTGKSKAADDEKDTDPELRAVEYGGGDYDYYEPYTREEDDPAESEDSKPLDG